MSATACFPPALLAATQSTASWSKHPAYPAQTHTQAGSCGTCSRKPPWQLQLSWLCVGHKLLTLPPPAATPGAAAAAVAAAAADTLEGTKKSGITPKRKQKLLAKLRKEAVATAAKK